jgi:hypothetical protein
MILRGVKTVEYRSRPTRIIGEPFYIYAARGPKPRTRVGDNGKRVWSDNLAMLGSKPGDAPPVWMMELAELLILNKLPTGVIVGAATISTVTGPIERPDLGLGPLYEWHLTNVTRADDLRKPVGHPQPVWFQPF